MAEVLFFIAALSAIAGAAGAAMLRNPFHAVLSLVFHLLALAALFLLLRAEFVAAAQVIVYAGGVMVLYVFVVAYVGSGNDTRLRPLGGPGLRAVSILFGLALAIELMIAMLGTGLKAVGGNGIGDDGAPLDAAMTYGSPKQIGELLLTRFLFPFEAASILLLVAAVGAVMLARRRTGIESGGPSGGPLAEVPPMPAGVGSMKEGIGFTNPTAALSRRLPPSEHDRAGELDDPRGEPAAIEARSSGGDETEER